MRGPYPDSANDPELAEMRAAANSLEKLLQLLSIEVADFDLLTWQVIKDRYQHTGLGELALIDIEDQKSIIHRSRQHQNIGVWEFNVGLIYLHWGEPQSALAYFATAQRYWTLVNHTAAAYLALFAQGYMQQFDRLYAAAMANFLRIQHNLERLQRPFYNQVSETYVTGMKTAVAQAITNLRRLSSQLTYVRPSTSENLYTPEVQSTPQSGSPAGHASREGRPIPGHLIIDEQLIWYQIQRNQTDDFLQEIKADDWVLVRKSPSDNMVSKNKLIVIYDESLNSSIRLINTQANVATAHKRIFLGRVPEAPRTFTRDKDGNIQISNVQIAEQQEMQVNHRDVFGIVLGFWSSNVNV